MGGVWPGRGVTPTAFFGSWGHLPLPPSASVVGRTLDRHGVAGRVAGLDALGELVDALLESDQMPALFHKRLVELLHQPVEVREACLDPVDPS